MCDNGRIQVFSSSVDRQRVVSSGRKPKSRWWGGAPRPSQRPPSTGLRCQPRRLENGPFGGPGLAFDTRYLDMLVGTGTCTWPCAQRRRGTGYLSTTMQDGILRQPRPLVSRGYSIIIHLPHRSGEAAPSGHARPLCCRSKSSVISMTLGL